MCRAPIDAGAEMDARLMAAALAFGRRNLGLTGSNPAVGALLAREGRIVGRGATATGGRPHAETEALADAGEAARGATLYVTLEPCSHHGRTPPCADAIVRAGVARVVSALDDPDPRVAGRGHARLAAAGIAVTVGVGAEAARRAHLGHFRRMREGRPMLTLKLAQTADGYAAGDERDGRLMITAAAANARAQMMRASHDAIMVGVGTIRDDDPLMTVRMPGMERYRPLRVALDARLETPASSRIAATAHDAPVLILAGPHAAKERAAALTALGVEIATVPLDGAGRIDLSAAMAELARRGLARVFSEGGPRVGAALIEAGLADEIVMITAARPLGRPGLPALDARARAALADPARFVLIEDEAAGPDRIRRYATTAR